MLYIKFGIRKPSFKKSFSARTTGRATRSLKRIIIPGYGKKGVGIFSPSKASYNKLYNRTSKSLFKPHPSAYQYTGGAGCLSILLVISLIIIFKIGFFIYHEIAHIGYIGENNKLYGHYIKNTSDIKRISKNVLVVEDGISTFYLNNRHEVFSVKILADYSENTTLNTRIFKQYSVPLYKQKDWYALQTVYKEMKPVVEKETHYSSYKGNHEYKYYSSKIKKNYYVQLHYSKYGIEDYFSISTKK